MSRKDPLLYLYHIVESISYIKEYSKEISKSVFMRSVQDQDSIIRRIEIIGEASKRIPYEIKEIDTTIPWKNIAGMRDVLVHDYFEVELELAWQVVKKDLPILEKKIKKIIKILESKQERI